MTIIIWNHSIVSIKCIQISTNMPGIGLVICEHFEKFDKQNDFVRMVIGEINGHVQSITAFYKVRGSA